MLLALLLAIGVTFTLPSMRAHRAGGCAPDLEIPVPLESLYVFAEVPPSPPRVFRAMEVRGWEGASWFVPMQAVGDSFATVWVVTTSDSGGRSCESNRARLNAPPTGVPHPGAPPRLVYYDIAGRRLERRPTTPGVYFSRAGRSTKGRVVIIR